MYLIISIRAVVYCSITIGDGVLDQGQNFLMATKDIESKKKLVEIEVKYKVEEKELPNSVRKTKRRAC